MPYTARLVAVLWDFLRYSRSRIAEPALRVRHSKAGHWLWTRNRRPSLAVPVHRFRPTGAPFEVDGYRCAPPILRNYGTAAAPRAVGWVERSDTHHLLSIHARPSQCTGLARRPLDSTRISTPSTTPASTRGCHVCKRRPWRLWHRTRLLPSLAPGRTLVCNRPNGERS